MLNKGHFFALGVASVPVVRCEARSVGRYALVLIASLAICATDGSLGKMLPPMAWTFCLAIQMRPDVTGLREASAVLCSRTARYLGAISYCLYLVNEPIHKITGEVLGLFSGGDGRLFTLLWVPLSIGLPLLAAAWLHTYLEAPALRWGRDVARRLSSDRVAVTVQVRS